MTNVSNDETAGLFRVKIEKTHFVATSLKFAKIF
jgi:hypothetical protein